MKELTIEEKAKRYDEAIERANELNYVSDKDSLQHKTVEHIFPELKESDDEMIRKAIENVIRVYGKTQGEWIGGYDMDTLIIHLRKAFEKQDKQKLAWSKYDEEFLLELSQCCDLNKTQVQWLLSLKDRVQPQPKQEWSEEDKQIIKNMQNDYHNRLGAGIIPQKYHDKIISWLKSLRPQSTWKPSEEQMSALSKAIAFVFDSNSDVKHSLESLYNELKKL